MDLETACQKEPINYVPRIRKEPRADTDNQSGTLDRIQCLVTGCKNNYGKGYKHSSFSKHVQSHMAVLLKNADEREKITHELQKYGNRVLCKGCCMVVALTNDSWLCKSCAALDEVGEVSKALSNTQRGSLVSKIRTANRFHLRVITEIPKSLRRLWSDCVTASLIKFAKAKTDKESFLALESWVKLKAVLVIPVWNKKQHSSNRKFHQEQMLNWVAGN